MSVLHRSSLALEQLIPEFTVPAGMAQTTFHAMGTTIALLLPRDVSERATQSVTDLFATWERALSRFQPDSELSRLNAQVGQPVVVSPLLLSVLTAALDAAEATQGIYDPTLLRQLITLGYDRSFDTLPRSLPATSTMVVGGGCWRGIQIDRKNRLVTLPEGAQLDFGGIAKGMAVDAALDLLREQGVTAALVNAGGDLGVIGSPPALDHWPIQTPTGDVVALRGSAGAMATSGVGRRQWVQGGQRRHHLIDPRTGASAQSGLWSVTVAADRCMQAEVAAKAALILGPEAGTTFLQHHRLSGLLIREDGTCSATGAWPQRAREEAIS
jgi:thiamine biosynthesis lipoprotein